MNTNNYTTKMKRWFSAMLIAVLPVLPAMGGGMTSTYYYDAHAYVSPSGAGLVYVSKSQTTNPAYATESHTSGNQSSITTPEVVLYYYAKANEGYIFDHWASGSADAPTPASTEPATNFGRSVSSTSSSSPTQITYYAVFTAQTGLVKVVTADASRGAVSISDPDNQMNEEVTITAIPDATNGVAFLGWSIGAASDNPNDYITTENPYTFTVTAETEGTYYANFSNPLERTYCRLKNNLTGNYISVYGTTKATNSTTTQNNRTFNDGFIFTNSLKMISADEAQGNPTTVLLRAGNPMGVGSTINVNLSANLTNVTTNLNVPVAYTDLITPSTVNRQSCPLTIEKQSDGTYKIYTTVTLKSGNSSIDTKSYLCDTGTGWARMQTRDYADGADSWSIYILDENTTEGSFGANTKAKYTDGEGHYYTTMYTTFPYQLLDGVKAYYLPANESTSYDADNNTVEFTEVTTGKVPAHTAVILECNDVQSGTNNRLLPLTENVPEIVGESLNLLKGYASVNGATRANDKDRMYVFSVNNNGKLGFFHYSKTTMTPNKAYLELPEMNEEVNEAMQRMTFSFGEEDVTPTKVELIPTEVADDDAPIYDLQGRRVFNTIKGIYIQNGKKFLVK